MVFFFCKTKYKAQNDDKMLRSASKNTTRSTPIVFLINPNPSGQQSNRASRTEMPHQLTTGQSFSMVEKLKLPVQHVGQKAVPVTAAPTPLDQDFSLSPRDTRVDMPDSPTTSKPTTPNSPNTATPATPNTFCASPSLPICLGERPVWWSATMGQRSGSWKLEDSSTDRSNRSQNVQGRLSDANSRSSCGVDRSKNLHFLLSCPVAVESFRAFLVTSFSCENLLFWEAADEAMTNPSLELFNNIFNDFIDDTADGMVNISSAVKLELSDQIAIMNATQSVNEELLDALDEAKEEIFDLMDRDMLPKFLASDASKEWRHMCNQKSRKFSLGVWTA